MPTVTPDSPGEFSPFASEFEHVRAHRGLEQAIEAIDSGGSLNTISVASFTAASGTVSGVLSVNTTTTVALIANRVGFGGAVPGTNSTAAAIKGFYRTAAPIAVAVPAITMLGVTTVSVVQVFSIETQVGNPVAVGDAVVLVPTTAIPANVGLGNATVSDTNSITVTFVGRTAATVTLTFTCHVFSVDLT